MNKMYTTICKYRNTKYEIKAGTAWEAGLKNLKRRSIPIYVAGNDTIDCRLPCTNCTVSRCRCLEEQVDKNYVLAEENVQDLIAQIADDIDGNTGYFYHGNSVQNAIVSRAKNNKHLIDYLVEKEN